MDHQFDESYPFVFIGHVCIFFKGNLWGANFWKGLCTERNCVSKSARLILGGKFTSQNRLGYLIVGRKLMSVICRTFLLKRRSYQNSAMQVLCLYGIRKSKPRVKSELSTQTAIYCDTFWLQWSGTRNSSLANEKIYVLMYSCFLLFWIWGQFPSTSPRRLYLEGRFNGRFFEVSSFGGLYLEGLIFGILR